MNPPARRRIITSLKRRAWHRQELYIYACAAADIASLPHPRHSRRDAWDDLAACTAWSYAHLSRAEYLDELDRRRREGSHHLYSIVENGVLVHYGWLSYPQERAPDPAIGLEFIPPPASAVLWDYFTHPTARGRGLYRETLWQCLHDAVDLHGAAHVFIYVDADNEVSRRVIERAGFTFRGSLVRERRLFWTRRYTTFTTEPLEARHLASGRPAQARQRNRPVFRLEHGHERQHSVGKSDQTAADDQLGPGPPRQEAV